MANSVDNRVVRMEFDNSGFQQKISSTIESIKNLDKSLRLENGEKGLKGVQQAAQNMGLDKVAADVESLNSKFSVFGIAAATAISNITNRVMAMGESMISAITIDPIKDGFKEYELQLSSVQTILTNTRKNGTTMKDVTDTLAELNKYADQTVYNFGDMTRSIGQFTQAGVGLEQSTVAIKGMSNIAAGFNVDNAKLQNAMYQMSQALSAGKVQLMDWRSMLNAGMGGEAIQTALRKVSEEMGTGAEAAIAKQGSFNESLREGWLTTEVAIETFNRFTKEGAAGHGKWWEEQAAAFEDAATKIKTFPQLIDVIKEELGSGWATSWQYIMGDFEEAQELFTNIGTPITNFVSQMHDARNEVLQFWHDVQEGEKYSGRDYFLQGLGNIVEAIHSIVAPIGDAFSEIFSTVEYVEDEFGNTTATLSGFGKEVAQGLVDASKAFADFTSGLKLGEGYYDVVKNLFTVIFSGAKGISTVLGGVFGTAVRIAATALDGFAFVLNLVFNVLNTLSGPIFDLAFSGFNALAGVLGSLFDSVSNSAVGDAFRSIGRFIEGAARAIASFLTGLSKGEPAAKLLEVLGNRLSVLAKSTGVGPALETIANAVKTFGDNAKNAAIDAVGKAMEFFGVASEKAAAGAELAKDAFEDVVWAAKGAGGSLLGALSGMPDMGSLGDVDTSGLSKGLGSLKSVGDGIADSFGKAKKAVNDFVSSLEITDILVGISGAFAAIAAIAGFKFIKNLVKVSEGFGKITEFGKNFIKTASELPEHLNDLVDSFGKSIKTMAKAEMLKGVAGVIKSIAISIAVLAGSLFLLSLVDSKKLQNSTLMMVSMVGALMLMAVALNKFSPVASIEAFKDLLAAAAGLQAVGVALLLIAAAAKILGTMDFDTLGRALGAIGAIMFILVMSAKALVKMEGDMKAVMKLAGSIMIMAMAIGALATACLVLQFVQWESIAKAGVVLAGLVGAAALLSKISASTGSFLKLAGSMLILAGVMGVLAVACLAFALVPIWGILQAGIALAIFVKAVGSISKTASASTKSIVPLAGAMAILGAAMIEIALAAAIFSAVDLQGMANAGSALGMMVLAISALAMVAKASDGSFEKMGASLALMAVGMGIFAGAIALLGLLPWQVLVAGLFGLAGAFGVILGAGAIAGLPLVSAGLTALASSLVMIGAGIGLAGLGFVALAMGLSMLAAVTPASCAAIVAALGALGEGIGVAFAALLSGFVEGFVVLNEKIAEVLPRLQAAGQQIVTNLTSILNSGLIVEMGRLGGQAIIQFLAGLGEMAGALVAGAVIFISSILTGIAEHIGEIADAAMQVAIAFINGIANALNSNTQPLWDAINNLLISVLKFLEEGLIRFVEMIPVFGEDAANQLREWSGVLEPAAGEVKDKTVEAGDPKGEIADNYNAEMEAANSEIQSGGDAMAESAAEASENTSSNFDITAIPDEARQALEDAGINLDSVDLGSVAGGQADSIVSNFSGSLGGMKDAVSSAGGEALAALKSIDFAGSGKQAGSDQEKGYETGLNKSKWRSEGAAASGQGRAGVNTGDNYGAGHTVGAEIGNGLIAGLASKIQAVKDKAAELGRAAKTSTKSGAEVSSPSKYTIWVGENVGEGLVVGMNRMISSIRSTGSDLGSSATSAVSLAAQAIDGIDWDANPVITPVLDTSLIDAGMAGLFTQSQSISAGYVASKYALSQGADAGNQNGINSSGSQYNFYLQYDAGEDATQLVRDMTVAVRQSSLTEG